MVIAEENYYELADLSCEIVIALRDVKSLPLDVFIFPKNTTIRYELDKTYVLKLTANQRQSVV